jgi:hypothetical protein
MTTVLQHARRRAKSLLFVLLAAAVFLSFAPSAWTEMRANPDKGTLWIEDGKDIVVAEKWPARDWYGKGMEIKPAEGGGFTITPKGGYSVMRYMELNPTHPWLVWSIRDVEPFVKGYRGFAGPRMLINNKPSPSIGQVARIQTGLFAVDLRQRTKKLPARARALRMDLHGASVTFDYIKMVKQPENFIAMTSPAFKKKGRLDIGDTLTFRVTLADTTEDVSLRFYNSYVMPAIKLNGSPTLQLKPEDEAAKIWSATVTIKSASGGRTDAKRGYIPGRFLVKALVLGGGIKVPLWTANSCDFNIVAKEK